MQNDSTAMAALLAALERLEDAAKTMLYGAENEEDLAPLGPLFEEAGRALEDATTAAAGLGLWPAEPGAGGRFAFRLAPAYPGDLAENLADPDEEVAAIAAAWERAHSLEPRAIGAEERGELEGER